MTKYHIYLEKEERVELLKKVTTGSEKAKIYRYAQILLHKDKSENRVPMLNVVLAKLLHMTEETIGRVCKSFCARGMNIFTSPIIRHKDRRIDARLEAHLIHLVCTEREEDAPKWTLQLLADKLVSLEVIDSISPTSVGTLLKKTNLSLFKKNNM
jgi:hypothetical protein